MSLPTNFFIGRGGGAAFDGPSGWFTTTRTVGSAAERFSGGPSVVSYIRSKTDDIQVLNNLSATNSIAYDLWAFYGSGTTVINWEYDAATDSYNTGVNTGGDGSNSGYNLGSVWALGGYAGFVTNGGFCRVYKKINSGSSTTVDYIGNMYGFALSEESLSQVGHFISYSGYTEGSVARLDPTTDATILAGFAASGYVYTQSGGKASTHIDMKSSDRLIHAGHGTANQMRMARWNGSSVTISTTAANSTRFGNDWTSKHMAGTVAMLNHDETPNGNYSVADIFTGYYGWVGSRGYSDPVHTGYGLNGNYQSYSQAAPACNQVIYCPYKKTWRIITSVDINNNSNNSIYDVIENSTLKSLTLSNQVNLPVRSIYMSNRGTASTAGNYHPQSKGIIGA